jgi:hypothetical protein
MKRICFWPNTEVEIASTGRSVTSTRSTEVENALYKEAGRTGQKKVRQT